MFDYLHWFFNNQYIAGIIVSISAAFIAILLTFECTELLRYRTLLRELLDEIRDNYYKIATNQFDNNLNELRTKFNNPAQWIGLDKVISVWARNPPLRTYLPDNAYNNFINKGFYNKIPLSNFSHISIINLYYREFSRISQEYEIEFNCPQNRNRANLEGLIDQIRSARDNYLDRIRNEYQNIPLDALEERIAGSPFVWLYEQMIVSHPYLTFLFSILIIGVFLEILGSFFNFIENFDYGALIIGILLFTVLTCYLIDIFDRQ